MNACNMRYLKFVSSFPDRTQERHNLNKVTRSIRDDKDRSVRGINFFRTDDIAFILALLRGENQIQGIRNRKLQTFLPDWSAQKIGRTLRRFWVLGLLKKVAGTAKYYFTKLGNDLLVAALQLKERLVLPAFAAS